MEDSTNTVKTEPTPQQQPNVEPKVVLMPGQEHEDELDLVGAMLFGIVRKGYNGIKNLFSQKK